MISEAPKQRIRRIAGWIWRQSPRIAATLTIMAYSAMAFGQTCAMCYNTASAAKPGAIQALRSGILVLLIPPALMFIGIFTLAFRSRERPEGNSGAGDPWSMAGSPEGNGSDFDADPERW